jgi:hypothetical protein
MNKCLHDHLKVILDGLRQTASITGTEMNKLGETKDDSLDLEILLDYVCLKHVLEDSEDVLRVAGLLQGHKGRPCVVP